MCYEIINDLSIWVSIISQNKYYVQHNMKVTYVIFMIILMTILLLLQTKN